MGTSRLKKKNNNNYHLRRLKNRIHSTALLGFLLAPLRPFFMENCFNHEGVGTLRPILLARCERYKPKS